jgi:hypothetical protein
MTLQRGATSTSVIDVLDHVLDKGIVIDAWVRVSLIGIDLITVEARVVVASIATYLNCADLVAQCGPFTPIAIAAKPQPPSGGQAHALPHSSVNRRGNPRGPSRRPDRRIRR